MKKKKKLNEKVKNIISNVLNIDVVDDNANQENLPQWDSLAYLSILAGLEDEFKVEINDKNINKFNSLENIVNEINNAKTKNKLKNFKVTYFMIFQMILTLRRGFKFSITYITNRIFIIIVDEISLHFYNKCLLLKNHN